MVVDCLVTFGPGELQDNAERLAFERGDAVFVGEFE